MRGAVGGPPGTHHASHGHCRHHPRRHEDSSSSMISPMALDDHCDRSYATQHDDAVDPTNFMCVVQILEGTVCMSTSKRRWKED